jgi:hypothetical protein
VLGVGWLILAVAIAILLTTWITFTLTRLDRLHARVDAAQAAMDAQLVRRAAALQYVAEADRELPAGLRERYERVARAALDAPADAGRADAENAVSHAVAELAPQNLSPESAAELQEASARVRIARRFYNDAVRDTRALRGRRLPRLFRMAGRRAMPEFFDIDDTLPIAVGVTRARPAPPDDRDEDQQ